MAHRTVGWVTYLPSYVAGYGAAVDIKVDNQTASNNGSAVTTTPSNNRFWPGHRADMRFVYGVESSTKRKDTCVALSPSGSLFVVGSTFSDDESNSYTVIGLRQERYSTRNLK